MAKYTLNIGQELHSDTLIYRIESVLGQGSFGITYKAKAFTVIKGKFGEELVETNTPKAIKEFFMNARNLVPLPECQKVGFLITMHRNSRRKLRILHQ